MHHFLRAGYLLVGYRTDIENGYITTFSFGRTSSTYLACDFRSLLNMRASALPGAVLRYMESAYIIF
jgi:hypothetical protein